MKRFTSWIRLSLPGWETVAVAPLYAWLSFLCYAVKLWLTPSWGGRLARNHEALLRFEYTNNEQSRLLQFYIPEAIHRLTGASIPHAYAIARLVFVFAMFCCFHRFLRKWFSTAGAFAGVVLMAAAIPFTYMDDLQESWALLMLVFVLALQAIRDRRMVMLIVVLFIGGLTNETMMIVPGIFFLCEVTWSSWKTVWRTAWRSFLVGIPLFLTLGPIRYINRDRPVLGGGFHWPDNWNGIAQGLAAHPLDYPSCRYLLFLLLLGMLFYYSVLAAPHAPLFLRRSLWIVPVFVFAHLITGKIDEPRQMLPLGFILIPMTLWLIFKSDRNREMEHGVSSDGLPHSTSE